MNSSEINSTHPDKRKSVKLVGNSVSVLLAIVLAISLSLIAVSQQNGHSGESENKLRQATFLSGTNCDLLTSLDLSGCDLRGRSFSLAFVSRPMIGADFSGDDVSGATFSADASNANFSHVHSTGQGPTFFGGYSIAGANFVGAQIPGVIFTGNNAENTNFVNANLSNALLDLAFNPTDFTNADFSGANLSGAGGGGRGNYTNAKFNGANLSGFIFGSDSDLTNANLRLAVVAQSAFQYGVVWRNTTCPDGTNSDSHGNTCVNNLGQTPSGGSSNGGNNSSGGSSNGGNNSSGGSLNGGFTPDPAGKSAPESNVYSNSNYVALGDSYSSGEGLGPFTLGEQCHRSPNGYPSLLNSKLNFASFTFVACSGELAGLVSSMFDPNGHRTPWITLSHSGQRAQTSAITPKTSLATVTIGGNDLQWSNLVKSCIGLETRASDMANGILWLFDEPHEGLGTLPYFSDSEKCSGTLLQDWAFLGITKDTNSGEPIVPRSAGIHSGMENALKVDYLKIRLGPGIPNQTMKLLVIGYPTLLHPFESGYSGCRLFGSGSNWIALPNPVWRQFTQANRVLNQEIQIAVKNANAVLSKSYPDFVKIQYVPLDKTLQPLSCGIGPISADLNTPGFSITSLVSPGSFHPTVLGQSKIASAVENAL